MKMESELVQHAVDQMVSEGPIYDDARVDQLVDSLQRELHATCMRLEAIKDKKARLEEALKALTSDNPPATAQPRRRKKLHLNSTAHLIRGHTADILREAGRPMSATEIYRAMSEKGLLLSVNNPVKQIGRVLWGASEFTHTEGGYWFGQLGSAEGHGI
ncbi:hypothetical protein E2F50_03795 [Rhizobium deserti]|uniref:HTH HARE-type domain-containing protein n=1 Tax=Rhizobium deserti TaxID=2547961 RepID=A0A4R5UMZ8_9HYPH|nr:hypothetical protein [Rhizobium deserti]TDK39256.1 hypothetical protein E2F50_03795 [Rhizobium deserti]